MRNKFISVFFILCILCSGSARSEEGGLSFAEFWKISTELFWRKASVSKVLWLIRIGASVTGKDDDGKTLLMQAAKNNADPAVIETLIKEGSEVNAKCRA
ncbi:MAG: hypothetical protein IJ752_01655 [Alphaproteobacteria bacterium]|nr:hypothetical protein [Alphaproteobacteria bacterium]